MEVEVETEEEADPFGEPEAEDAAEPEVTTQMVMAAAKKYDTKNGREKMLKILGRFLPAGKKSINDVPSDQLAACLKAFGG